MGLLNLFRRSKSVPSVAPATSRTKPRGKIAAASLAQGVRSEPKQVADLAERMDRDYQVQLARRVLTANIQSVRVTLTVKRDDERANALAEQLQSLWERTLPNMLEAVSRGRVAFEKILAYDSRHNLLLTKSLDALPFRETNLVLNADGNYEGIDVLLGKSPVRIPADKSWWLALDATVMEPHGRSQYLGAPSETFQKRQKTRRRFDTLLNRLSVRGMIAYHPLDEEDERGNRYDPGEVLASQLDAMVAGGHLLLPNTRHPTLNEYEYKIQETTEVLNTAPMLAAITEEDAEQLRTFGIPEKTVTEGDAVGSHAMVKQQTLVLYAVVDGLLAQFTNSFQKYVVDKSIGLNFDPEERPQITIGFARLAERPDSILAQVVTGLLSSPQLNPLVLSGDVDVEQLLESAGILLSGDVRQRLQTLLSQQCNPSQPASPAGTRIPGGDAHMGAWDPSKHPRGEHGRFATEGLGRSGSSKAISDQGDDRTSPPMESTPTPDNATVSPRTVAFVQPDSAVISSMLSALFGADPMGHHYFPKELLTGLDNIPGFSKDVIDFAWGYTSGKFQHNHPHIFGEDHREYNNHIRELFKNKLDKDKDFVKNATPADMKKWIDRISNGQNPFNGEADPDLEKYINKHVTGHIDTRARAGTQDELIEKGRRFQKTALDRELQDATEKFEGLIVKNASEEELEVAREKVRRAVARFNDFEPRMPARSRISKYFGRAMHVLGKSKLVKFLPGVMGVIAWHENVKAYGEWEGTARTVPVLGDFVSLSVDGSKILLASSEIASIYSKHSWDVGAAEREDKRRSLDKKLQGTLVGIEAQRILRSVEDWTWEATGSGNQTIADDLTGALKELTGSLNDAIHVSPDEKPVDRDEAKIKAAEEAFKQKLRELRFSPPGTPRGPSTVI